VGYFVDIQFKNKNSNLSMQDTVPRYITQNHELNRKEKMRSQRSIPLPSEDETTRHLYRSSATHL